MPTVPHAVIPAPESIELTADVLVVDSTMPIVVDACDQDARRIGQMLAAIVGESPAVRPEVLDDGGQGALSKPGFRLTSIGGDPTLGPEGYTLTIDANGVLLAANAPAGLFYGVQTIRQLLPAAVEFAAVRELVRTLPIGKVVDRPRFGYRGMMLDVVRHFFKPADVKQLIDHLALYKINHLHLHLTDDQGWRIEVPGWPELTKIGASSAVGGEPGGFYSVAEYEDLVRYAAERFVTIVPEIDMPGHTFAALASYAELNADGKAVSISIVTEVGKSCLALDKDITYKFLDDVIGHVASISPGPLFHIGGDEVLTIEPPAYHAFMERAQALVNKHGKRVMAWDEIAGGSLADGAVIELWRLQKRGAEPTALREAVAGGARFVMAPADQIYLDMKYDERTPIGLKWAGLNSVRDSYDWDPSTYSPEITEASIDGVEAPLWSETVVTVGDLQFLVFPRVLSLAEIGWTRGERQWSEFRTRLGAHGPRLSALGINAYRCPEVPWVTTEPTRESAPA